MKVYVIENELRDGEVKQKLLIVLREELKTVDIIALSEHKNVIVKAVAVENVGVYELVKLVMQMLREYADAKVKIAEEKGESYGYIAELGKEVNKLHRLTREIEKMLEGPIGW